MIVKYIGYKLALNEPLIAEAKKTWQEEEYLRFVAECKALTELEPAFREEIEATLRKRFGLVAHKCIFYNPSVEQWVADVTGQLTEEDIMDALSQMSGVKKERLEKANIYDNTLFFPFVEDMVELFEGATGKHLLNKDGRLWHLPETYTYRELAQFFATI
ncbi:MAG: hypothetical protein IJ870_07050 [Alphaproteobacteria bacterium]|nr:hypothetical protein [Alphaproteobacteria bacterium]